MGRLGVCFSRRLMLCDGLWVWNLQKEKCLYVLIGHEKPITCVAITPNGLCVSGSENGFLRVWDICTGKCVNKLDYLNLRGMNISRAQLDTELKMVLHANGVIE
ncbi:hypothetical protein [Aristaeella lactis]|uniref:hypothetical protein n=1 Tax=Aristaeella lactis TaxID=3046383 RepID=UPI0009FF7BF9|nr:hypothetical protein JYE50_10695 [Aristaeella lactis]